MCGHRSAHRRESLVDAASRGADTGVRFRRYDRPGSTPVAARFDRVCDTTMCTALGDPAGAAVGTVEHLMAALAICEIDNLLVEVSGPELPIMDGSAQPFVFLIECAGTVEQEQPRRWIEVLKPVSIEAHGKLARLEPADHLIWTARSTSSIH